MNFKNLKSVIEEFMLCGECTYAVTIHYILNNRQGFAQQFRICCPTCTWSRVFFSSGHYSFPGQDPRAKKPFEVNVRATLACREIGKGNEAMKRFTTLFNMPPTLSRESYNDLTSKLNPIFEEAANESMLDAVEEIRLKANPNCTDDEIIKTLS